MTDRSAIILGELRSKEPREIVTEWIVEATPYVFNGNRQDYFRWKDALARAIEIDPRDIVITGSACVGISLNPGKDFRAFHAGSDIDVAIISPFHFETAWRTLRKFRPSDLARQSSRVRFSIDDHRKRLIYWGTIATDKILGIMPFAETWLSAAAAMARDPATLGRDIKFRIYRDFDSFRSYLHIGVQDRKEALLSGAPPS